MAWLDELYLGFWLRWHCSGGPRFWFCRCKADFDFEE